MPAKSGMRASSALARAILACAESATALACVGAACDQLAACPAPALCSLLDEPEDKRAEESSSLLNGVRSVLVNVPFMPLGLP